MNDHNSISILFQFLEQKSLTKVADQNGISIVRVTQIVKAQSEILLPDVDNIKYCSACTILEQHRERLLNILFDNELIKNKVSKTLPKKRLP